MEKICVSVSQRMWVILRKMTCFTIADVQQLAEVDYGSVYRFLRILRGAGYVKKEARKGGRGFVKWQLIKDTGPKAPHFDLIYCVKDLNTGEEIEVRDSK